MRELCQEIVERLCLNDFPDIDPILVMAIIRTESSFDPKAYRFEKHIKDASYGLMQLLYGPASWMGYKGDPEGRRNEMARYLDENQIGNRPIMAGNVLRQPAYKEIECKVIGDLKGANRIHEQGIWIGCFPGITPLMLEYVIEKVKAFYG